MVILSPFYNFRTAVYLPSPKTSSPVNRLPHSRHPLPVYENTPILGHPSRLAFLGSCILLRDHRSPDAPALIMSLPPRDSFLSCILVGSLFSLTSFSFPGRLFIARGAYQDVGPRVQGVDRSPCFALSSPSLSDSCSRCFPLDMFGMHTRRLILPYCSFLCYIDPFNRCPHIPFPSSLSSETLLPSFSQSPPFVSPG